MARLDPRLWGDRQQVDLKHDYSLLTEEQRLAKAYELIGLVHEIQRGPELPPPLEHRAEEGEDEQPKPVERNGRIGRSHR